MQVSCIKGKLLCSFKYVTLNLPMGKLDVFSASGTARRRHGPGHQATIGEMSCRPALGGLAKGHLVPRVRCAGRADGPGDRPGIHFRMLSRSKTPPVLAPGAARVTPNLEISKLDECSAGAAVRAPAAAIELEIDGVTVRVGRGAEAGTVATVIRALKAGA